MSGRYMQRNGMLHNPDGSTAGFVGDEKYFAVVAMCGHCGPGYFIPILFPVKANDLKSAVVLAKDLPRVKRDSKNCILYAAEISDIEYYFLKNINDLDKYLTQTKKHSSDDSRRVIMPSAFKNNGKQNSEDEDMCSEVKYAEEYGSGRVLQKYFAPIPEGDKTIFRKRINFKELLKEYFTANTWFYALYSDKKFKFAFTDYIKLFGLNNDLKIGIDTSSPDYDYFTLNGKRITTPLWKVVKRGDRTYCTKTDSKISKKSSENMLTCPHKYGKEEVSAEEIEDMIMKMSIKDLNNGNDDYEYYLSIKELYILSVGTGSIKSNATLKEIKNYLEEIIDANNVEGEIIKLKEYKEELETIGTHQNKSINEPSDAVEKFNRRFEAYKQMQKENKGKGKE